MTTEKRNEAAGGSKREKERAGSHGGCLSAQSVCMHKKRNERNEREKVPAHASSQQSAAGDATERTQSAKEMNANERTDGAQTAATAENTRGRAAIIEAPIWLMMRQ